MATQREIEIKELLRELGIRVNVKGYHYLAEAIQYRIDAGFGKRDTCIMYRTIAHRHGDTETRVERAMRAAITTCFQRGNLELIDKLFGYTVGTAGTVPVSTFVATLAEYVQTK